MALESLLTSLKSGVAEVTGVQVSHTKELACNPERLAGVTRVSVIAPENKSATHVTPIVTAAVTAQPAPIGACTPETPVTPKTIKGDISVSKENPCGPGNTATASLWWMIHFPDRDSVEVARCLDATHAENLERHPDAVAAEPFTPTIRQLSAPLTAHDEEAIRAWLALIEGNDPAILAEVVDRCQRDADARDYFTRGATAERPTSDTAPDDRRNCDQCRNLRQRVCVIAKPEAEGLVVATRGYRPDPVRKLRCVGYTAGPEDADRRSGHGRWPELIQEGDE